MGEAKISPEILFCQQLASNQTKLRFRCLKKLTKWLTSKSSTEKAFTEDSMLRLWKGIYYFFWMCDKPLVQEEMAEAISRLIHCFQKIKYSFLFIDTFFQTMTREWFGIDQFRLEKYMMFTRKFLHQSYTLLMNNNWEVKHIKRFRKVLRKTVLDVTSNSAVGFQLHIFDMYMEELAKVGRELSPRVVRLFMVPFCHALVVCDNDILRKSVCKNIFEYLLDQCEEEEDEEIAFLKFNAKSIQKLLMKHGNNASIKAKNRKAIYNLVKSFQNCSEGAFVYDETKTIEKGPALREQDIIEAAARLIAEDEVFREESQSHKNKKNKKHADMDSSCMYEDVL